MFNQTSERGFVKDSLTGVVINENTADLQAFYAERKRIQELHQLSEEMQTLRSDFNTIKGLLTTLVEKNK